MMRRRLRHPSRLLLLTLALVQVVILGAGTALAASRFVSAPLDDGDAYVLLVLGSDAGPPRGGSAMTGRADGFHLLVVSPDKTRVSILSFPRDSYVPVPGFGTTKINAGLVGGPENAVVTAEGVTGLDVDDWIVTGFNGLIAAINEIGGLEIDVEQRLYDPRGASSDLQPGLQRLDGWQTLTYVRDRKSRPNGDFGRSESHARTLVALHRQLLGESPDASRLGELVRILRRHTKTSISPARMFRLAALAMTIPPENVQRQLVGGAVGMAGAASVVRLTDQAYAQFADLREDGMFGTAPPPPDDGG